MSLSPTLTWFVSESSDIYNMPPPQTTELLLLKIEGGCGFWLCNTVSFWKACSGHFGCIPFFSFVYHKFCTNIFEYLSQHLKELLFLRSGAVAKPIFYSYYFQAKSIFSPLQAWIIMQHIWFWQLNAGLKPNYIPKKKKKVWSENNKSEREIKASRSPTTRSGPSSGHAPSAPAAWCFNPRPLHGLTRFCSQSKAFNRWNYVALESALEVAVWQSTRNTAAISSRSKVAIE